MGGAGTWAVRTGSAVLLLLLLALPQRGAAQAADSTFYRRMAQYGGVGMGRFYTRAQIDAVRAPTLYLLLARDPAVRFIQRNFGEALALQARGGTCLPALSVDGSRIANDLDTDLSAWLQPDQIEGIEIYPTAEVAPAELRAEGCGAIAFWTRAGRGELEFTRGRIAVLGGFLAAVLFLLLR